MIAYGVGCFAIKRGDLTGQQGAGLFLAAWDQIEEKSVSEPRPFYYVVGVDGRIRKKDL